MPEIGIGAGRNFRSIKDVSPIKKTDLFQDIYKAGVNFGIGVADENSLVLGSLYAAKAIEGKTNIYKYDPNYNIYSDPQLENFMKNKKKLVDLQLILLEE